MGDLKEPSALKLFVHELNKTGSSSYTGMTFAVHTRLQVDLYPMVEALTKQAGTSRNKVMNQLVEIGINTTLASLPKELVSQLHRSADQILHSAMQEAAAAEAESS